MAAPKTTTWPIERVEELKRLLAARPALTAGQIGAKMGMPRSSIIGKTKRLGLALPRAGKKRPKRTLGVEEIVRCIEAGMTRDETAKHFRVNTHTLAECAGRAGLSFRQALRPSNPKMRRSRAARPRPYVVAVPTDEPKPVGPQSILDIGQGCKWLHGDVGDPAARFCGHERVPERPYCAYHCSKAYTDVAGKRAESAEAR